LESSSVRPRQARYFDASVLRVKAFESGSGPFERNTIVGVLSMVLSDRNDSTLLHFDGGIFLYIFLVIAPIVFACWCVEIHVMPDDSRAPRCRNKLRN